MFISFIFQGLSISGNWSMYNVRHRKYGFFLDGTSAWRRFTKKQNKGMVSPCLKNFIEPFEWKWCSTPSANMSNSLNFYLIVGSNRALAMAMAIHTIFNGAARQMPNLVCESIWQALRWSRFGRIVIEFAQMRIGIRWKANLGLAGVHKEDGDRAYST